jgi:Protein of unknown function (DUF2474)
MAPRVDWVKRVAWVVALWLGGVAAMALIALLIRLAMHWAGMRS